MVLINFKGVSEGEFFLKWMKNRLIENNRNIISAELGGTGTGKSYRDLRKAELWYEYYFKEKFPIENICFGVAEVMKILSEGKLRKGEVIVFEEAGVNLGARDWQSKISKMFNYILQSFRSMNLALFMNLPYLSMLDKQARNLLHYYSESVEIDKERSKNICKPFFLQVAQSSGKPYRHYPKVFFNGRNIKLKRFEWSMPGQYLVDNYEQRKKEYLKKLTTDYSDKLEPVNLGKPIRYSNGRDVDMIRAKEIYDYSLQNPSLSQEKIGEKYGISQVTVSVYKRLVESYNKRMKNLPNMVTE